MCRSEDHVGTPTLWPGQGDSAQRNEPLKTHTHIKNRFTNILQTHFGMNFQLFSPPSLPP